MNLEALLRIRANVQGENNIRRLGNSLQGLQGQAKNAAMALSGLRAGVGGLIGLVGGGFIVSKIFGDTATLQSQARSLEVLTGNAKIAGQIVRELQAYGSATPFESTELIETAKRLNAFGVGANEVVSTVKRLGDVAGATGANLGELATAYGQVISKGRLQGEELLQFQERGVALSQELQKMYKLQGQEFTKALEGGRISAEAVEVAIERLTDKGGKYADGAIAQSDTLNGKLSTLKDTVTALSQTLGKILEPALQRILTFATDILDTINKSIQTAINGPQNANTIASVRAGQLPFGGAGAVDKIIGEARRRQLQDQAGPGFLGLGFDTNQFIKLLQQQPEFRQALRPPNRPRAIPALLPGRADTAEAEARKAAAEAKRAAAEQERLEDRRKRLTLNTIDLQRQLQDSVADVNAAYEGIGATPVDRLFLQRDKAITENNRLVDELTRDVVKLATEVNEAGGKLDIKPFETLINTLSEANVALADKDYLQGLKDLLPSLQEYDAKIKEVQRGKTELTEVEKLNAQINLLQLDILAQTNPALAEHVRLLRERAKALDDATAKQKKDSESIGAGIRDRLQEYYNSVKDLGGAIGDAVVSGLQGLEDQLTAFVTTGKANFKELAASILSDLARIALRAAIIQPIVQALGGMFPGFKFADGGIMTGDGPMPLKKYANGGIANTPQLALFGEGSKPEAFVPLPDGRRIPVAMQGGGGSSTSVTVNVDAKGTSVQGDSGRGEQLARVVAQAVQAELIKQKRPGGLIAA
jgi:tape measure domain-containing protein